MKTTVIAVGNLTPDVLEEVNDGPAVLIQCDQEGARAFGRLLYQDVAAVGEGEQVRQDKATLQGEARAAHEEKPPARRSRRDRGPTEPSVIVIKTRTPNQHYEAWFKDTHLFIIMECAANDDVGGGSVNRRVCVYPPQQPKPQAGWLADVTTTKISFFSVLQTAIHSPHWATTAELEALREQFIRHGIEVELEEVESIPNSILRDPAPDGFQDIIDAVAKGDGALAAGQSALGPGAEHHLVGVRHPAEGPTRASGAGRSDRDDVSPSPDELPERWFLGGGTIIAGGRRDIHIVPHLDGWMAHYEAWFPLFTILEGAHPDNPTNRLVYVCRDRRLLVTEFVPHRHDYFTDMKNGVFRAIVNAVSRGEWATEEPLQNLRRKMLDNGIYLIHPTEYAHVER